MVLNLHSQLLSEWAERQLPRRTQTEPVSQLYLRSRAQQARRNPQMLCYPAAKPALAARKVRVLQIPPDFLQALKVPILAGRRQPRIATMPLIETIPAGLHVR